MALYTGSEKKVTLRKEGLKQFQFQRREIKALTRKRTPMYTEMGKCSGYSRTHKARRYFLQHLFIVRVGDGGWGEFVPQQSNGGDKTIWWSGGGEVRGEEWEE